MQEGSNNALYVYGIVIGENRPDWSSIGIDDNQVFLSNMGEIKALVHRCNTRPYNSESPEKVKEMVLSHNAVLENAGEMFNGILPFSFNTIIHEKENKSAEENLKDWMGKEEKKLKQIWKKIEGMKEYGLKFFYEPEKLIPEPEEQKSDNLNGKGDGIRYLLKAKEAYQRKDNLIRKVEEKRQEILNIIQTQIKDVKICQPRIKLLEEKKDLLLSVSVLCNEQQFDDVKKIFERSLDSEDYVYTKSFPPYSFMDGIENGP